MSTAAPATATPASTKQFPFIIPPSFKKLRWIDPQGQELHADDSLWSRMQFTDPFVQRLEGVVIAQSGSGSNTTITVRRVFQGVGVEMNFHLHSPVLGSLEVLRRARVRRAKLYYLRQRTGKNARLKELFVRKDKAAPAAAAAAAAAK